MSLTLTEFPHSARRADWHVQLERELLPPAPAPQRWGCSLGGAERPGSAGTPRGFVELRGGHRVEWLHSGSVAHCLLGAALGLRGRWVGAAAGAPAASRAVPSSAPVRAPPAPFPRAGSSPSSLLVPGLWGTSWPGQPRWELPGQLVHPLPLAFVRARVRSAGSCPTAGEGDVWWLLLLCCCQHRPWKLSFPACYFWLQHVIKSVP